MLYDPVILFFVVYLLPLAFASVLFIVAFASISLVKNTEKKSALPSFLKLMVF